MSPSAGIPDTLVSSVLDRTPEELLDHVLKFLIPAIGPEPSPAIKNCTQVNRRIRRISLPHMWKRVFCSPKVQDDLENYTRDIEFFRDSAHLAGMVQQLSVAGVERDRPRDQPRRGKVLTCALAQLISVFPSLTYLRIDDAWLAPCDHDGDHAHHPFPMTPPTSLTRIFLREVHTPQSWEPYLGFVSSAQIRTLHLVRVYSPGPPTPIRSLRPIVAPTPPNLQEYYSTQATPTQLVCLADCNSLRALQLYQVLPDASAAVRDVIRRNVGTLESVLLGRHKGVTSMLQRHISKPSGC